LAKAWRYFSSFYAQLAGRTNALDKFTELHRLTTFLLNKLIYQRGKIQLLKLLVP